MADATRLASQGSYRCRMCGRVDKQERGLVIAFAGNVLLAVCPGCINRPIVISRQGGAIAVEMEKSREGSIILASDMHEVEGMHFAKPDVKKVEL